VAEANGQPTYQYKNIAEAHMWGGEAEAEWNFREGWRARGTVTGAIGDIVNREAIRTLYHVDSDKAPLPSVPPFRGTFAVRWSDVRARGWAEASTRYSWRTNRLALPVEGVSQIGAFKAEWISFDLMTGCRFGSGQRQLIVLGVRNIADMQFRQAFGSLDEPGRSFVASFSTKF
jgi:outer membrane receptor protein involved in Fe transport